MKIELDESLMVLLDKREAMSAEGVAVHNAQDWGDLNALIAIRVQSKYTLTKIAEEAIANAAT